MTETPALQVKKKHKLINMKLVNQALGDSGFI